MKQLNELPTLHIIGIINSIVRTKEQISQIC